MKYIFLVIAAALVIAPAAFAQTEVSVLMVYTDDARAAVGGKTNIETDIISAIDDGNLALDNSNVDILLTIAGMREVTVNENNYSGTSGLLADLTDPNDATFGIVHQWRDQDSADIVYLVFEGIVQNGQANAICGAGIPCDQSFESQAFATGQRGLQDIAPIVIHELGHVMGLRHDRTRDCGNETITCGASLFPYSFGHIDPVGTRDWGTIMAGGRPFPLLDFFSNPNLDNPDTGQALGVIDRSDAARALNDVSDIIANFRGPDQPDPVTGAPLVGDFNGDSINDIFFYNPGPVVDPIWLFDDGGNHQSIEKNVGGTYERLIGDFNGDGISDIFWYRSGTGADFLWLFDSTGGVSSTRFNVNGTYKPFVGDFNGDGISDIFWYGPGTGFDVLWLFDSSGGVSSVPFTVNGTYETLIGDFNGDGISDIFWYGPGTSFDVLWLFDSSGAVSSVPFAVNGTYETLIGDFNGDGISDIFWYSPGTGFDVLWLFDSSGAVSSVPFTVNGTYETLIGDFNGDGISDIFWYGPGTGFDELWLFNSSAGVSKVSVTVNGIYEPVVGDFNGDNISDIFWYRSGEDNDSLWLFDSSATVTSVEK